MSAPALLTVADVARELGSDTKTVRSLCVSGDLPSYRIGRLFKIRRVDFEKWFAAQRVVAGGKTVSEFRNKEAWE